jgi:hypothetical protein
MNSPENDPLSTGALPTVTLQKKSRRRAAIITLIWLVVCGGVLATLVRAIQAAREAARCQTCSWHLKQLGYGLHFFDTANGGLPPAYLCNGKGRPVHSWETFVAPYMSHYNWRSREGYNLKEPWDSPHNSRVHPRTFDELQCPSAVVDDRSPSIVDYVAVVGPDTMWPGDERVALAGAGADTILLIEMPKSDSRFLEPRSPTVDEFMARIKSPTGKGIRCIHPKGLAYLTVGGEVRWFPSDTDPEVIRKLFKRDPSCKVIPAKEGMDIVEHWEQRAGEGK